MTQCGLHTVNTQQIFRLINIDGDIAADSFMLSAEMAGGGSKKINYDAWVGEVVDCGIDQLASLSVLRVSSVQKRGTTVYLNHHDKIIPTPFSWDQHSSLMAL